jgi:hypothetical protein
LRRDARDGVAMMRAAEGQWVEGAIKTATALTDARNKLKNDAAFGQWCEDN